MSTDVFYVYYTVYVSFLIKTQGIMVLSVNSVVWVQADAELTLGPGGPTRPAAPGKPVAP